MIHIKIDDGADTPNSAARFYCGLTWPLPAGDNWRVNCPGCNPGGPRQLGTPISQLSGLPGEPGYAEFVRIARSWGYP